MKVGGSVSLDGTGLAAKLLPGSTNPAAYDLQFNADFIGLNNSDIRVYLGPAEESLGAQRYRCTNVLLSGVSPIVVRCRLGAGVGNNLLLQIYKISSGLWSAQSLDHVDCTSHRC